MHSNNFEWKGDKSISRWFLFISICLSYQTFSYRFIIIRTFNFTQHCGLNLIYRAVFALK